MFGRLVRGVGASPLKFWWKNERNLLARQKHCRGCAAGLGVPAEMDRGRRAPPWRVALCSAWGMLGVHRQGRTTLHCPGLACRGGACGGSACQGWAGALTKASLLLSEDVTVTFLLITQWLLPVPPGDTVGTLHHIVPTMTRVFAVASP